MEENLNSLIKKSALTKGLILGAVFLFMGIFTFYFTTSMTDSMWLIIFAPILFSIIIPIAISVFVTLDLRKQIGGYWIFRQAVTGTFIMFFIAYIVSSVGRDLVFAKLVEPQMAEKMSEAMVSATSKMMEKSGADQEKIDEKTTDIQKQFDAQTHPTPGKVIQGIAISIILIFVFSLIFAAIFKKEKPRNLLEDAIDPAI